MQDWEWEVADPSRFTEFITVYEREPLDEMERFSLMEIIIQCAEDLSDEPSGAYAWSQVERLLRIHPELHWATVRYWACLDGANTQNVFHVAPRMRQLWASIHHRGADA